MRNVRNVFQSGLAVLFAISIVMMALAGSDGVGKHRRQASSDPAPRPARWIDVGRDVAITGNPETVLAKYDRWKASIEGADPVLVVHVRDASYLSSSGISASGKVSIGILDGRVSVELRDVPDGLETDAWLVETRTDDSGRKRAGDRRYRLGTLRRSKTAGRSELSTTLDRAKTAGLRLDLVAITERGRSPQDGVLLYGMPSLFQQLYFQELTGTRASQKASAAVPALRVQMPGAGDGTLLSIVEDSVAAGEALFHNETFNGNGRTCGTCHPADNNFTLDPTFIARLPHDDPLFVAEYDPDLRYDPDGHNIEIPDLLRSQALILVHADGHAAAGEPDRFVMRSVPHLLGLGLSLFSTGHGSVNSSVDPNINVMPPNERLGWSGDGSAFIPGGCDENEPGSCGTLKDFVIGAVRAHTPHTLARVAAPECASFNPGPPDFHDFCLPDAQQLTDLEAYMLSLGRQVDGLAGIHDVSDPIANGGCTEVGGSDKCGNCHYQNGGTNDGFVIGNRIVGVEAALQNKFGRDPDPHRPPDGGFGWSPQGGFPIEPVPTDCPGVTGCPDSLDGSYGNRFFNAASLVEAADTGPYFHNNLVRTLEEAVAFYQSADFDAVADPMCPEGDTGSIGDESCCDENDPDVIDTHGISRFLRGINALENIERQAGDPLVRALCILEDPLDPSCATAYPDEVVQNLLKVVTVNLEDAVEVLANAPAPPLAPGAIPTLNTAIFQVKLAQNSSNPAFAKVILQGAVSSMCCAFEDISPAACPLWEHAAFATVCP